jgi:hypothetical protein
VVHKLGFGIASMTLPEGVTHSWQSVNFNHREKNFHQAVHEISDGTVIELVAGKEMSEVLFNLLGDLAAETWFKAAARFRGRKDSKAADRPGGSVSKAMIGFENLEESRPLLSLNWPSHESAGCLSRSGRDGRNASISCPRRPRRGR